RPRRAVHRAAPPGSSRSARPAPRRTRRAARAPRPRRAGSGSVRCERSSRRSYRRAAGAPEPLGAPCRRTALAYAPAMPSARKPSYYSLLFTYVVPYFAYVLTLMLPEDVVPKPWAYGLATIAAAAGIAWAWRWYVPLRGPRSPLGSLVAGAAIGVVGTGLWLAIKAPFYEAGGEPWTPSAFWMRVLASTTVVAVFEELLFRGLVL